MIEVYDDKYFMRQALSLAEQALEEGEVPVGAVVVSNKKIIAKAYNQTEKLNDATAHAEMLAITSAANHIGNKYLKDCTLYVTLEPCAMCASATYWSQLGALVFGASDEKRGFYSLSTHIVHPKTNIKKGLMKEESQALLKQFFDRLRK